MNPPVLLMPNDFVYNGLHFTTLYRQRYDGQAGGIAALMNSQPGVPVGQRYYAFLLTVVNGVEQIDSVLSIQLELDPAVAIAGLYPFWPKFSQGAGTQSFGSGSAGADPG
jgi:hypothetical protein